MTTMTNVLRTIYKLPCWGVCQGYGSMLMLEFGNPHLAVREPFKPSVNASKKLRRLYSLRSITIRGDSRLTILGCKWMIRQGSEKLAESGLPRARIRKALAILNGQKLLEVSGSAEKGTWVFKFDLDGSLELQPVDDSTIEQWWVSQPTGYTFSVRSDGCFRYSPPGEVIEKARWRKLKSS